MRELQGALQHIIENEHVELLMHPRIVELLKKKWHRFAGYQVCSFIYYHCYY